MKQIPERRRVTLKDVAAASGLSLAQVSRALAGSGNVAESTRARVRELAEQLGYRPSWRARTLALGTRANPRCAVVSFDVPAEWLHRSIYALTLPGILAAAGAEALDIHMVTLHNTSPREELAQFLAEDRADGLLLLSSSDVKLDHLATLYQTGVPFVLVNGHFGYLPGSPAVNCVTPDWSGGTTEAVRRLYDLGHRDLAFLIPGEEDPRWDSATTHDHRQGWLRACSQHELDPDQAPIVPGPVTNFLEVGYVLGQRLIEQGLPATGRRPTAIVAYNDSCARGVLQAADKLGIRVPEELSVIGFDDMIAEYLTPPLCTYDPHLYRLGEQSVHLLASLLRKEASPNAPQRIMVPLDFVCRNTCAKAPSPDP